MDNLADDPSFIDAIMHEVKSQGLFDQFRKECLADVDTKPAYQNLRQRVEGSVIKFVSQQKWTDNIRHKNQQREKLRKHLIDCGFLETGVERIVDQVVIPKIATVFHPKVAEIVYNYLGIEKPTPLINGSGLDLQTDFLPEDLEAVSPDSDKKSSSTSSDIQNAIEQNANEELNESRENADDFESPAFEPLETRPPSQAKHESNDSHASAISGLTSQESVESEHIDSVQEPLAHEGDIGETIDEVDKQINERDEEASNVDDKISHPVSGSPEIAQNDSQLSQVSSNSRLSIITSSEGVIQQQVKQQPPLPNPRLDITEEAQMPKFNENSNEEEGEIPDSNEDEPVTSGNGPQKSNFDLRKETYEFKGTERNRFLEVAVGKSLRDMVVSEEHDSFNNGGDPKEETHNISDDQPKEISSPIASAKFEDNSSQSERSLRICEDSTIEQRALDNSNHFDNCDSVKTPLNDEHSTQSAPDVEKMDSSQVEVVSLAAVQQHAEKEKKSVDRHRNRERDNDRDRKHSSSHRHRSSSSRDRRSHSSSKHSGSGSSRKPDHRERKSENGNSNSNSGGSKRTHDKKKDEDDHYSSHDQPTKKRRSTDRDSNDGADTARPSRPSGESGTTSGETGNDSNKHSRGSEKRSSGQQHNNQANLNESLESSFEGFDEDQLHGASKPSSRPVNKSSKASTKSSDKGKKVDSLKGPKKVKKHNDKSPKDAERKNAALTMDVFSFSFDKPAKLGNNGEYCNEDAPSTLATADDIPIDSKDMVLREEAHILLTSDSIDQLEEGVIVLEPTEIERVIRANEELLASQEVTSSIDDETLQTTQQNFPATDPDDLVTLAIQPVVVDQMLTKGDNMDLELLIGDKQLCGDESTLGKIQLGLDVMTNKIRKPKIASNFSEARKLMKVRKQIEREEKKKREQAMVLAKKLITENGNASEEDQGIELEFVCDSNRKSSGPSISSPIRQKAKHNKSFEEDELLFFPEQKEVFPTCQAHVAFLRQKTSCISFAEDISIEHFKIVLHTLENKNSELGKDDVDDVLAIVMTDSSISDPDQKESFVDEDKVQTKEDSDELGMELPKLLKMRATSIDSDHEMEPKLKGTEPTIVSSQKAEKRKSTRSPPVANDDKTEVDYEELIEKKQSMVKSPSAEEMNPNGDKTTSTVEPVNGIILNSRTSKTKRLGLPKPRGSIVNNNSTTILTVDISDVKTTSADKKSPTSYNNNNGTIKAQRYSSDDLYKPRSLNGLRTRTRTRANEGVRAEVGFKKEHGVTPSLTAPGATRHSAATVSVH